ncbi:MAG: ATP phosphoribosyltransferase [Bacillota bacterium]
MNNDNLVIALPKGRLGKEAIEKLIAIGIDPKIKKSSRKLIITDEENKLDVMFVKAGDVITYIEEGVADIGVVGRDNILEERADIYVLKDLDFGHCTFCVAGYADKPYPVEGRPLKVATKYPSVARRYFNEKRQPIEVFFLSGSVELGPIVGLSDVIVDIVETGNTLKANGLSVLETMHDVSAKLIANKGKYRFKMNRIQTLMNALERT